MMEFDSMINRVIQGDCLEVMKSIPDNSIDLVATDPQYGWNFMSRDWDQALPSQKIYDECFRVLKSGAFMFWMSGPRMDCLIENGIRIRQAGFRVDYSPIFWVYASGFSKAMNISLAVDKRECKKQLIEKLGREPTSEELKKAWKEFREVVGIKNNTYDGSIRNPKKHKSPAELSNIGKWGLTQTPHGLPKTEPHTSEAKALAGSFAGFQPKPGIEIVIVAMKPLSEKSYIDQALKDGKGTTQMDDCRIPVSIDDRHNYGIDGDEGEPCVNTYGKYNRVAYEQNSKGRFPANLLVSSGIDLDINGLLELQKKLKR